MSTHGHQEDFAYDKIKLTEFYGIKVVCSFKEWVNPLFNYWSRLIEQCVKKETRGMALNKGFSFAMIILALFLTACNGIVSSPTTTSSLLTVIDKGYSSDDEEYWISAYDPNNQTKKDALRIIVHDEIAWGLIEENKEYVSTYIQEEGEPAVLEKMEPK
jgi:hypothetical protein